MFHDRRGLALTAPDQAATALYDETVEAYLCTSRDVAPLLERLGNECPDMIMAHCLRGYIMLLPSRMHLLPEAMACLARARTLQDVATGRERQHVDALAAWCDGDLDRCLAVFEDLLLDHPHDILAYRLAHYLHFFIGDLPAMLASSSRAMSYWNESVPGYGYILGCRSFALEENQDPVSGEAVGRRAVELNPKDLWAGHAVAHCLETQGRRLDGISWISAYARTWRDHGAFANHLWWHRSLHYLELERFDAVLDAFDQEFWTEPSEDNIDIQNATSILMRLVMLGLDVGDRWERVAGICAARVGDCLRPFNDLHYLMGLAMSGRLEQAAALLDAMRQWSSENVDNAVTTARISRDVGIPVGEAIVAYARGDHPAVIDRMPEIAPSHGSPGRQLGATRLLGAHVDRCSPPGRAGKAGPRPAGRTGQRIPGQRAILASVC